ncbi:DUF6612 family protein [Halobacillus litoralis]|uniref:DUF6612 family protein n=1 Tax=Halobacillus litoralis TaxID=45668 RepID=UPI003531907D
MGEQIEVNQSIYSEFRRFNEIKEIVVPKDILNQAEKMEDMPGDILMKHRKPLLFKKRFDYSFNTPISLI